MAMTMHPLKVTMQGNLLDTGTVDEVGIQMNGLDFCLPATMATSTPTTQR